MKKKIASLDLLAVLKELRSYCPAKLEKVYQPEKKDFLFQFYSPEEDNFFLRILPGRSVFISKKRTQMGFPPHFCMFLRKHLNNSHLERIKQKDFERILEFEFERGGEKKILVAELFSKGNLVLLNDNRKIISCLSVQEWKHRTIKAGEKYQYPPSFFVSPIGVSFDLFKEHLEKDEPVKQLAKIGLGGEYAEEIIARSEYQKDGELTVEKAKDLYNNFKEIMEKVESGKIEPVVYLGEGKPIFYAPFKLETYEEYKKREFESMNQALEFYYRGFEEFKQEEERKKKVEKEKKKLKSRLEEQKEKKGRLKAQIKAAKKKADLIYQHIPIVKEIIQGLEEARAKNYSWEEIKEKIRKSDYNRNVKKIEEHEGEAILDIDGEGVVVDFTIGANDNAQKYYHEKKKLENKLEGVKKAISDTKKEIKKVDEGIKETKEVERKRPERKWYERFHNFKTSNGKLAISGKDAQTNEKLIQKYLEKNDLVFHAKIKGSPFTILKNGQKASKTEKKEAVIFTASHSKAWKRGIGSLEVYHVEPDQVSKEAPPGEYIPKGSFMIRGKKKFLETKLEIAIGVKIQGRRVEVVSAPKSAIEANHYGILRPGGDSKIEVSGELKRKLIRKVKKEHKELVEQIKRDEIIKLLPAGGSEITKIK